MPMVKFSVVVGTQGHQIAQGIDSGNEISRHEFIDWFDVAHLVMDIVTTNCAGFGLSRFAVRHPCYAADLGCILLQGFGFKYLQWHDLPVNKTRIAAIASGAPGLKSDAAMFATTGNALSARVESPIDAVGAGPEAVLRVGRFGAAVQAVIHASSYWILLANPPLLHKQAPASAASHCGSCSSLRAAFWSSVHALPSGCSDATLRG